MQRGKFRRRRRSPSFEVLARSARENQKVARCARAAVGQKAVRALGGPACIGGPGMPRVLCLCVGLLLVRVSRELNDISRARKLCGRHLLQEIVKLCGSVNWSHIEEEKLFTQLLSQASEKVETFIPDWLESSQTTFLVWRRATNPGKNVNQRHVFSSVYISYSRICSARHGTYTGNGICA